MDQLVFNPIFFTQISYDIINLMDKCKLSACGLDIFNYFSYFIFRVWWLAATLIYSPVYLLRYFQLRIGSCLACVCRVMVHAGSLESTKDA